MSQAVNRAIERVLREAGTQLLEIWSDAARAAAAAARKTRSKGGDWRKAAKGAYATTSGQAVAKGKGRAGSATQSVTKWTARREKAKASRSVDPEFARGEKFTGDPGFTHGKKFTGDPGFARSSQPPAKGYNSERRSSPFHYNKAGEFTPGPASRPRNFHYDRMTGKVLPGPGKRKTRKFNSFSY